MELGKILEFKKDLYFEGAVQADWFYSKDKASKVAENFVFHGKTYYGVDEQGIGAKKRIDTISLVKDLVEKLNDDKSNALSLAIADYGTGKSHLAVTLAQIFSGSNYMPDSYEKILKNIAVIDKESAEIIRENTKGKNFVMVLNGMRDFNLHSEILRAAQRSMKLYGLPDDCLRKLNRAVQTAELFFERNIISSFELFYKASQKHGWSYSENELADRIRELLMTDEEAFDIVNEVYSQINGQEIRWDEGLSTSSILEMLISEYCGMNGIFDHIIILFDEFGRYLEYASGVNAAKSGESGLQQIYELTQKTQNVEGYLHVINFIQSDIKTYLQRVDQTKNISRYIGRFDESEKYYISSNLETVFANLIQRKDKDTFKETVVRWLDDNEEDWKSLFEMMNRWLSAKGMWKDYKLFRKVAIEGIYPMHPIATYMLTNLSDYLQNRSSLTLISRYLDDYYNVDIDTHPMIMPEMLISGDLYTEMLSAEQEGRQKTQQCIKYDAVISKIGDKLTEKSLAVLRSNLILRILRFKTSSYEDAKIALSVCSGLKIEEVNESLRWLENEYAVLEFDDHACVFDFTEESNGAHDFKIAKKRLMVNATISPSYIAEVKIKTLAGILDPQSTNFGTLHKITTNEWQFTQDLYPIEDFSLSKAKEYISEWEQAVGSTTPKGRLIWLYVNKDTASDLISNVQSITEGFNRKPIVVMLLNDAENRLYDTLIEYSVLDSMDDSMRQKYERHFAEDFSRVENNLKDEIDELKKKRIRILPDKIEGVERMPLFLTRVFEEIYPDAVPFFFDNFVTKANNISSKAGGFYCSFLKMLLSNTVSEATIHNFVVEMRNRVESLFFITSATSWKCINEQYKVMPPQEKHANAVYEEITQKFSNEKEITCKYIYDTYCKPPYGMSEDVVTMMIAIVCANLSYCIRIRHGELKNINIWKDEVITNNDKKIDLKAIKESTLIYVDAGAVIGKYSRFFDLIKNNNKITEVFALEKRLNDMVSVDEVPEELEQAYLLARKTLESGKKAKNQWNKLTGEIEEKFEDAQDKNEIYNALVALEKIKEFSISDVFTDNGYALDDESKAYLTELRNTISKFVDETIDAHIASMNCASIDRLIVFRNHQNKIQEKLEGLGFSAYAKRVKEKKERELNNIEEIKSRQELREDYQKYVDESSVDKYTTYVQICAWIKAGKDLQDRVKKYLLSLGKDGPIIKESLDKRVSNLEKIRDRVNQDISDIWDDLYEIKTSEDVSDLIDRISIVLQKGISQSDQEGLSELKDNLQLFVEDIGKIRDSIRSRKEFLKVSEEMKSKYENSDFDFEVIEIIDEVIKENASKLDQKEEDWKKANLSLGKKTREEIHRWKQKTQFLPEFLSEETISQVSVLNKEADELISEGKIEDVIFYFEKLDAKERKNCLNKIKKLTESEKE